MTKVRFVCLVAVFLLAAGMSTVSAWHISGTIYCDNNGNGIIDEGDIPLEGVRVVVTNGGTFDGYSNVNGYYSVSLPDAPDVYSATLDMTTLPGDAVILHPPGGQYDFELTDANPIFHGDWLINSSICQNGMCWMTGGGVKFDSYADMDCAQHGPRDNLGGNVFPSCSPEPGDGGHWNHVAHRLQLHFKGNPIDGVMCCNVPGIEPGSESPETPFNYIEFWGTGTLKGIKGNKVDHGIVSFYARVEDRNEPGSNGAKDGEDIDRYFLHVFADAGNPNGTTLMCFDADDDCSTMDPIPITGGNLQLHISSCDDPPTAF